MTDCLPGFGRKVVVSSRHTIASRTYPLKSSGEVVTALRRPRKVLLILKCNGAYARHIINFATEIHSHWTYSYVK
jgi:hypothetical protein